MATEYKSKHGIVSRPQCDIYMNFVDCRNFVAMLPEDKREGVTADFDSLNATVQGFKIGVRIVRRDPYKLVVFEDDGAPFHFGVSLYFEEVPGEPSKTDFHIDVEADLNLMMKMMLGSKIKSGLDKIVDSLVAVSEGRMPEGVDESMLKNMKF